MRCSTTFRGKSPASCSGWRIWKKKFSPSPPPRHRPPVRRGWCPRRKRRRCRYSPCGLWGLTPHGTYCGRGRSMCRGTRRTRKKLSLAQNMYSPEPAWTPYCMPGIFIATHGTCPASRRLLPDCSYGETRVHTAWKKKESEARSRYCTICRLTPYASARRQAVLLPGAHIHGQTGIRCSKRVLRRRCPRHQAAWDNGRY